MNLFIMESVNWFGKKYVQAGKCILVASIESLESQYKTFLKTLWFFNYNQFPNFDCLFTGFNWPIHCEKDGVLYL